MTRRTADPFAAPLFDLEWAELDFEHPDVPSQTHIAPSPGRPVPPAPALLEPLLPGPPEWSDALGVFDLETTGIDTDIARIVTAHVGLIDETGAIVERKEWIIDPGEPIPAGATAVHGIDDARVRRFGRSPAEVVPEILDAIRSVTRRGFPLAIYNAPYDLTLLAAEAARLGLEPLDGTQLIVDALVLDRALDRYRKGKRTLELNAAFYGVPLESAHDAGADADRGRSGRAGHRPPIPRRARRRDGPAARHAGGVVPHPGSGLPGVHAPHPRPRLHG